MTAAYLINRTPTTILNNKSPFEVLFHTSPDYDILRMFDSLCYANVMPQPSDKFAARAIKGVFLGYPYAKKGYKILNLATNQVFISRDVRFVENIFPFKDIEQSIVPSSLFPSSNHYVDDDPFQYVLNSDISIESSIPISDSSPHLSTDNISVESPVISTSDSDHTVIHLLVVQNHHLPDLKGINNYLLN